MVATEAQKRASAVWREKNPDVNRQRAREGLRKKYENDATYREYRRMKALVYYHAKKHQAIADATPNHRAIHGGCSFLPTA
jgi:hypothetical protein